MCGEEQERNVRIPPSYAVAPSLATLTFLRYMSSEKVHVRRVSEGTPICSAIRVPTVVMLFYYNNNIWENGRRSVDGATDSHTGTCLCCIGGLL